MGALSGPSFALEVARGQPTALVLASRDAAFAAATAAALNSERLRIYSSADVAGVELGGAVKNVIAIAAGIADGLALGRNARAALVTRGLAEIVRLGVALGGRARDLHGPHRRWATSCSPAPATSRATARSACASRRAWPSPRSSRSSATSPRACSSAPAVLALARERDVEMPITEAVCAVLFEASRAGRRGAPAPRPGSASPK